jgi:outer membrane protein
VGAHNVKRGFWASALQLSIYSTTIFIGLLTFADPTVPVQDLKRETLTSNAPVSQPPLDLKSAVQTALNNNNAIKQARAKVEQDRWDTSTVRAQLYPNLNFVASAADKKDQGNNGQALFGGNPYHQYAGNFQLVQPLFAYGSLSAVRNADYNTKLNELDLEISERTLTQNVIQSFYQVLLNQRLLEILERQLAVDNESLATANSRLRTGRGQLLDVLTVKTQIALLKPQIESAHNQLESAGAQLATYLAEEGKYELRLKGALRGLRLADLQKRLDYKNARLPELERVRMQREQLQEQKDMAYGKHLPNVQLLGNYGSQTYVASQLTDASANGWSLMLQLTVPLFSGFQSIDERRSFGEQDRQLGYSGQDLENTLALNQVQSLKSLQSAGASLVSAEEAAKLADQEIAEVRRQYRLGTIDFVQFLTVEQSALQAYSSLDTIKYNNIIAFSQYFVATGQPLSILIDALQEAK